MDGLCKRSNMDVGTVLLYYNTILFTAFDSSRLDLVRDLGRVSTEPFCWFETLLSKPCRHYTSGVLVSL